MVCDPTLTNQVVSLADQYADAFVGSLPATLSGQVFETRDSLRKALAGTLIAFLSEVLLTVHIDERLPSVVSEEAGVAKTTASL